MTSCCERIAESFMNGEHDCGKCGRVTANGICTECRHGTSPIARLEKALAESRARALATQAFVNLCDRNVRAARAQVGGAHQTAEEQEETHALLAQVMNALVAL